MKRPAYLVCVLAGIATLALPVGAKPTLRLVYNASASAPLGWYRVVNADHVQVGDWVVVRLPSAAAAIAASRGYLPLTVPVLKQVAAVGGQHVCVRGGVVYIDGQPAAQVLPADAQGRLLLAWQPCRVLVNGELFLLNPAVAASFDSRYFGPVDVSFVRGLAIPLATK